MGHPDGCSNSSSADRQVEVRSTGAAVMPFDLDETKHTFTKTEDGGVQTVFALDPSDQEQIARIRSHFRELQMEFSPGDFPARLRYTTNRCQVLLAWWIMPLPYA